MGNHDGGGDGGDPHPMDAVAARASHTVSQLSSRRGFLARVGRVALGALGVAVVSEVLPIGRDAARASTYSCGNPAMCGFCGAQCGCANCSGNSSLCPTCACTGGWWQVCCHISQVNDILYRYRDCYSHGDAANGPCGTTKINNCRSCANCCPNPNTNLYYGQCSGTYMCTRVVSQGSC